MTTRTAVYDGAMLRPGKPGDSIVSPAVLDVATDAAQVLSAAQISRRIVQFSGLTAGRVVTTDTAANILAQHPDLNIGESFVIAISALTAFAITWAAGVGVTLAGRATTPASAWSMVAITKLSATTIEFRVL